MDNLPLQKKFEIEQFNRQVDRMSEAQVKEIAKNLYALYQHQQFVVGQLGIK